MAPSIVEHLFSGALSGLTSSTLLQPFDLLKTRQQQPTSHLRPTILASARSVLQEDGPRGLWRGTSATLARNIPGIAMYMTSLSALRARLALVKVFAAERSTTSTLPTLSHSGNLLAGASTRVAVGFILNPISVLKARYESSLHQLPSLPAALAALARAGPRELTRGFWASSLRDAPYAGLFVLSYEGAKKWAGQGSNAGVLPGWAVHTTSAAAAGTVATLATHPFDVIKVRLVGLYSEIRIGADEFYRRRFRLGTRHSSEALCPLYKPSSRCVAPPSLL